MNDAIVAERAIYANGFAVSVECTAPAARVSLLERLLARFGYVRKEAYEQALVNLRRQHAIDLDRVRTHNEWASMPALDEDLSLCPLHAEIQQLEDVAVKLRLYLEGCKEVAASAESDTLR